MSVQWNWICHLQCQSKVTYVFARSFQLKFCRQYLPFRPYLYGSFELKNVFLIFTPYLHLYLFRNVLHILLILSEYKTSRILLFSFICWHFHYPQACLTSWMSWMASWRKFKSPWICILRQSDRSSPGSTSCPTTTFLKSWASPKTQRLSSRISRNALITSNPSNSPRCA